jgi:hypothetical protein
MRKIRLLAFLLLPLLLLAIATTVSAENPEHFNRLFGAHLTGSQEVPPVDTDAEGLALYPVNRDGTEMRYGVVARDIISVTAGHIHSGTVGLNGPVVVNLYSPDACTIRGDKILCTGTITAKNLVGPLAGQPLSTLITMMRDGRTYTNFHTSAHPGGEIRGQIHRILGPEYEAIFKEAFKDHFKGD